MNRTAAMSGNSGEGGISPEEVADLMSLEARINALLPPQYQLGFDSVNLSSMGSAVLNFASDGRVAWGEIWTSFCDLALAGGPPHRGSLLEPPVDAFAEQEQCQEVIDEIARGIILTTGLSTVPGATPGWIRLRCREEGMAAWMVRAVMAENVFARREGDVLHLPAGPRFKLPREIKNVIVSVAKTCHYWSCHMTADQRAAMMSLADETEPMALLGPPTPEEARARAEEYQAATEEMEREIREKTDLQPGAEQPLGWLAVRCGDERSAAWLLRAMIAEKMLARREGANLCLPVILPRTAWQRRQT